MVLRDIFLEIADIFNFEYEQNKNGSYRVNTVIRNLVYPEIFLSENFSDNDLCYYLANPDFSYQSIPNIRNSFSELMNPKCTNNRFPIIYFCNQIEISKLYDYYKTLTKKLKNENIQKLQSFINNIADMEPTFYAQLKLICNLPYEYISWIIIYSMFNSDLANEKYDKYVTDTQHDISDLTISESGQRHKLSTTLISKKKKLNSLTALTFILCVVQIIFSILPYALPDEIILKSIMGNRYYCITLLFFAVVVLLIRAYEAKYEHSYSDLQIYYDYMDEIPDDDLNKIINEDIKHFSIHPFRNTSKGNTQRENLRFYLKIIINILLVASLFVSFVLKSFPFFVAWAFVSIILLMFIDRYFNDYATRTNYDSLTINNKEKPNPLRGLAKIYKWEYKKTCFNVEDSYYNNTVHVHNPSCYEHIFLIAYERLNCNLFIYNMVLIYFSFVFLLVEILHIIFGDIIINYLRLSDSAGLNLIIILFMLAIGIYAITTLIISRSNYSYLSLLAYASSHAKEHPAWAEKTFLSLYARGIIRDVDWMRGVFTYNVKLFEEGKVIEDIFPESDRMQFYHRHVVFKAVALITISLSYVALFCILIWHFKLYFLFIPLTLGCIFIYIFLCKSGLDKINKKKIIKAINSLSDN